MSRVRFLRGILVATLVLAGLGALLLAGRTPAHAANSVITFDDLTLPATVNTQYSAQGVTFNDVTAIDYSQPSFPAGFAHSGTVGVEQCRVDAVEFCTTPVTASFTAGQRSVKVWVGASFALQAPLDVRLTAFDVNHVSVGTADVTLPANPTAVTPIQNPLEVTVTDPTIRSLEVSVPGGYTSGIAVDDVEFSTAGPPPPCDATSVPTVQLTQPPRALVVQHNEFLLQGSVDDRRRADRERDDHRRRAAGSRKATFFPSLIHADGRSVRPRSLQRAARPGREQARRHGDELSRHGREPVQAACHWHPIPPGNELPVARPRGDRRPCRSPCEHGAARRGDRELVQANLRARVPRRERRIARDERLRHGSRRAVRTARCPAARQRSRR